MLKNYFKIAIRNLRKEKLNTLINIFGLAIGIASVIVLLIFIRNELSFDKFHEQHEQIYRLNYHDSGGEGRVLATTAPVMVAAMLDTYPEVQKYTSLYYSDRDILAYQDKLFYEDNVIYADSNFFQIFSFPLLSGNPKTALKESNTIVLTPGMAKKYFGQEDPLGKTLTLNKKNLKVTGVVDHIPQNSHLQFDFLVSFLTYELPPSLPVTMDNWGLISFNNYLLINEGADIKSLENKFDQLLAVHTEEERAERIDLKLQPVTEIYYHSAGIKNNYSPAGNIKYTYILSAIAILIVFIAGFNFMNIATARSIKRGKEVGVRKVLGASRAGLAKQFIGESVIVALIGLVLAIVIVLAGGQFIEKAFNEAFAVEVTDIFIYLPVFIGLTLLIGIIAGSYPALMISGFKPVRVLKGTFNPRFSDVKLRQVLLLFQFTITIAIIAGSIMISQQIHFMRNQNLGFDSESVIALQMVDADNFFQRYRTAKQVLQQNHHVAEISAGFAFNGRYSSFSVWSEQMSFDETGIPMLIGGVYFDYFKTMGIEMTEGREFNASFATDSADAVVINEAAAELFGWDEPLGETLYYGPVREGKVIGVTKDFNFNSLHKEVQPMLMFIPESTIENILVRVKPGNIAKVITSLRSDWQQIAPDMPFQFKFSDGAINAQYKADERLSNLILSFSVLAIIVACLGLYGLASIISQFKFKEIGIRKVLGANIFNITYLVSKQFLLLVIIANVIAWPLAYYYIKEWLSNFAYSMDIMLWPFLAAGFITFALALLTVSYHAVKAALLDPVNTLRSENS